MIELFVEMESPLAGQKPHVAGTGVIGGVDGGDKLDV